MISPLDSRYFDIIAPLSKIFSTDSYIERRIAFEISFFKFYLTQVEQCNLTVDNEEYLDSIIKNPSRLVPSVHEIEKQVHHDVRALVEALEEHFDKSNIDFFKLKKQYIHFGLTSEDVNSYAHATMMFQANSSVIFPKLLQLLDAINRKIKETAKTPMLSRTHGQPAVPTTFGKELAVVASRLINRLKRLQTIQFTYKIGGAVGNMNAWAWLNVNFSRQKLINYFSEAFPNIKLNLCTTQIDSHDSIIEYTREVQHIQSILIGFCQDMWTYFLLSYMSKSPTGAGSSTMPNKVNPIEFENAEGNFGLSNSLMQFFSDKLARSRLQRDLSDSTVLRNLGVALGHTLVALDNTIKGLDKLSLNIEKINCDLGSHYEILMEPVQLLLKQIGKPDAYSLIKKASQGHTISKEEYIRIIHNYADGHKGLLELNPFSYLGFSEQIAQEIYSEAEQFLQSNNFQANS